MLLSMLAVASRAHGTRMISRRNRDRGADAGAGALASAPCRLLAYAAACNIGSRRHVGQASARHHRSAGHVCTRMASSGSCGRAAAMLSAQKRRALIRLADELPKRRVCRR